MCLLLLPSYAKYFFNNILSVLPSSKIKTAPYHKRCKIEKIFINKDLITVLNSLKVLLNFTMIARKYKPSIKKASLAFLSLNLYYTVRTR